MKKYYQLLFALVLFFASMSGYSQVSTISQRNCAAETVHSQKMLESPKYRSAYEAVQRQSRLFAEKLKAGTMARMVNEVREIPVYVHVIYDQNVPAQNISDLQIESQIAVLNEDFRGTNADLVNLPTEFDGISSDYQIEFTLVSISRTSSTRSSWGTSDDMKKSAQGGVDPITPDTHLNMWVCEIGGGILGYAQFPGMPSSTDGVVMSPNYFGSSDYGSGFYLSAPFDKGRTATHEVGHYLNLRHIWGDGDCFTDDFVTDTPPAGGPNYGCPSYPTKSCTSNNTATSDLFMNFMDYTDDACMYMFTAGQLVRTAAIFEVGGARENLGVIQDGCDLAFPENITAVVESDNSILLSWNTVTAAESYNVTMNDYGFTTTGNSILIDTLTAGTSYSFRIKSNCATGSGFYSGEVNVTTSGCPDGPAELEVITDNYGAEVSWTLSYNGATVASAVAGNYTSNTTYTTAINFGDGEYEFAIADTYGDGICCLEGTGSYTIKDFSGNIIISGGDYGAGETKTFCLENTAANTDLVVPSVPQNLTVSNVGGSTATLSWNASTDNNGVEGYNVYLNGVLDTVATTTSVMLTYLQEGTDYTVTVTAFDIANNESDPSTASLFTSLVYCEQAELMSIGAMNTLGEVGVTQKWYAFEVPSYGALTITSDQPLEMVYLYTGSCSNKTLLASGSQGVENIAVNATETVYVRWDISDTSDISWEIIHEAIVPGSSCSESIIANYGLNTATDVPQWFKFTAAEAGYYTISSYGLATNDTHVSVFTNCEGTQIHQNDDTLGTAQSEVSLNLIMDQEIYILWDNTNTSTGNDWSITGVTNQEACNNAVPALTGSSNIINNATVGRSYFFTYTVPEEGYITLSSISEVNGYVNIYTDCNDTPIIGSLGTNLITNSMSAGTTLYIEWIFNTLNNPTQVEWDLQFIGMPNSCYEAWPAYTDSANEIVHASVDSSYFFSYSIPDSGYIELSTISEFEGAVNVYTDCNGTLLNWSTNTSLTTDFLSAGTTLYIEWIFNALNNPAQVDWDLQFVAINNSNTSLANAIPAELGDNIIVDGLSYTSYYYTYTMPEDASLTITMEDRFLAQNHVFTEDAQNGFNYPLYAGNDYTSPIIPRGTLVLFNIYFDAGNESEVIWNLQMNVDGKLYNELNFQAISNRTYGADDFELEATSSYDLPITFESSDNNIVAINNGIASLVGIGEVTITATQLGNDTIAAATPVSRTFSVNKLAQAIDFVALPDVTYGEAQIQLATSTDLGLPVTYTSSDVTVALVEDNVISYEGAGSVTITALQAGNDTIAAATPVSRTFSVNKLAQAIDFVALPDVTYGEAPIELATSTDLGLPVTYTSSDVTVALVEDNVISYKGAGSVIITASQAGNDTVSVATPVSRTFSVNKLDQQIQYQALPDVTYGEAPLELPANTDLGLLITYTSSEETIAAIENGVLSYNGAGSVTITAMQAGNDTVAMAMEVSHTFEVLKLSQEINWSGFETVTYGDGPLELRASATSGLAVTYTVSNAEIATVEGGSLVINKAGTTTVTAIQAGNDTINAADVVAYTLVVEKRNQFITLDPINDQFADAAPLEVIASIDSDLPLTYEVSGPASMSEGFIVLNGELGQVKLLALQIGNNNYNSAKDSLVFNVINPCSAFNVALSKVSDVNCFGGNDGQMELTINAGEAPFTFMLNGEQIVEEDLLALPANNYELIISDVNNCSVEKNFTIVAPLSLQASSVVTNSTSFEGNGSISVSIAGGVSPYAYVWNTGATTNSIAELSPNSYELSVTDANGCSEAFTFVLGGVTAIYNNLQHSVKVFPNPTAQQLTIDHPAIKSGVQASLFDIKGILVKQFVLEGNTTILDLTELRAGVYLLEVNDYAGHIKVLKN